MENEDCPKYSTMVDLIQEYKFQGNDAGDKYGAILIPKKMFDVSIVAEQFKAPWGACYLRLKGMKK